MEFIFVLTVIFSQILFINLFEVVKIVRAFRIHTFVDYKVLTVFLMNESMTAVRTFKSNRL